jgi:DNA-binding response OmpR family regulator
MDSRRVLLVARDPDAGELYGTILGTAADARSVWVPDSNAAQRLISSGMRFHALVFDVTLPSEWEACRTLAQSDGMPPVVVVTGWIAADGRFRQSAFDAGCAAFLAKPCDPRTLVDVVSRVQEGERHLEVL